MSTTTTPTPAETVRRGRPSDISDAVRVTISVAAEQLDWLDRQDADSRSQAVRKAIDAARGNGPATPPEVDLNEANASLKGASANEIITWAVKTFGDGLVMTSSFGAQSAVMLHLATQATPDIPVIFIDTGFHFPETYRFAEQLRERLGLNLKVYQSPMSPARMVAIHGQLWEQGEEGLNQYDRIRKVEPQRRALRELGATAWLAGNRREQTSHRAGMRYVDRIDNVYQVRPILDWSQKDVHAYLKQHDLPYHPLVEKGYKSIGDWHSTVPVTADQHEREGRFRGLKQECGLHLPASEEEAASRDSSFL